MFMNSPAWQHVHLANQESLERGRQICEHHRNIARLIALNNRRIAKGLCPLEFPAALVKVSQELMTRA